MDKFILGHEQRKSTGRKHMNAAVTCTAATFQRYYNVHDLMICKDVHGMHEQLCNQPGRVCSTVVGMCRYEPSKNQVGFDDQTLYK